MSVKPHGWRWRQGGSVSVSSTMDIQVLPPSDEEFDDEAVAILRRANVGFAAGALPSGGESCEARDTKFETPVALPWFEAEASYAMRRTNADR